MIIYGKIEDHQGDPILFKDIDSVEVSVFDKFGLIKTYSKEAGEVIQGRTPDSYHLEIPGDDLYEFAGDEITTKTFIVIEGVKSVCVDKIKYNPYRVN